MKKFLVTLLMVTLCLSFAGCGSSEEGSSEEPAIDKTVAAIAEAMGFEGEGSQKAYEMLEANDGAGFGDYEIYIYDDENSDVYKALTGDGYDFMFATVKAAASNSGAVLIYNGDGEPDQATVDKFNALNIK